uniref:Chromosome 1 open reading frame 115 n=2 Tax=Nothobranchius kadleci TaxID=1051664 RepID=A0A1A8BBP9_NOTKA
MLTAYLTSSANWRLSLHFLNLDQGDKMKNISLPSRLFNRNSATRSRGTPSSAKYQLHVDCMDQSGCDDGQKAFDDSRPNERRHREIHFSIGPEKYEPLMDDEVKEKKKNENYKKVKKNVGKALRTTWKCLMLGFYNFALAYSTPITVAAAFSPDFHHDRSRT